MSGEKLTGRETNLLPLHLNCEAALRGFAATIRHESLDEFPAAVHADRAGGGKYASASLAFVQNVAGNGTAKGTRAHSLVLSRVLAEHKTLFPKQLVGDTQLGS